MKNLKIVPIELSETDRKKIIDMIENPPKPNEKLVEAYRKHKEIIKDKYL
jgi:uncharacterized protein (DUF1778 family)